MATPDELEEQIGRLPRERVRESFAILAEWLKESRRGLESQISGLAIRLEETDRDTKRQLAEIHSETRATNGRVTDLENAAKLENALETGHQEWETQHQQVGREERENRDRAREKRRDRLTSVGLVLLGVVGGGLLQHIGI